MKNLALTLIFIYFLPNYLLGDAHIFLMHRFDDKRYPSTNISTEQLKKDFQYLKDNGYKVVSIDYMLQHLYEDKLVAFAIDDGYESFYKNGLKLFKEFNYPFTIFVYTEAVDLGYPDFMTWSEIQSASKFGDIAIHSYKHPHLTHLDPISIMRDTQEAIESFKREMRKPPKYYAYPYGEYDANSKEIIEAFGFDAIFNQTMGAISFGSDRYNLNRIPLIGDHNIKTKLRIKFLKVEWLKPTSYPTDGKLKRVVAKVPKGIKRVQLYVSGYSWINVDVDKNGVVDYNFQKPLTLKFRLTRIFIKTFDNRWGSTIIVK